MRRAPTRETLRGCCETLRSLAGRSYTPCRRIASHDRQSAHPVQRELQAQRADGAIASSASPQASRARARSHHACAAPGVPPARTSLSHEGNDGPSRASRADVLRVIGQLQTDAHVVGERLRLGIVNAENAQAPYARPARRRAGSSTISCGPRLVARDVLILHVGLRSDREMAARGMRIASTVSRSATSTGCTGASPAKKRLDLAAPAMQALRARRRAALVAEIVGRPTDTRRCA